MVRTRRMNARGRNVKTSTPWTYYYRRKIITGYGTEYGKNGDKGLETEDTGER